MSLKIIIYRGAAEIGGTILEVTDGSTRIIIDAGLPLQSDDPECDMYSLPKVKGLFSGDQPKIDAVIISHSHLDHYGLIPYIHNSIPIYMSVGTMVMVQLNLKDKDSLDQKKICHFESEKIFQVGSLEIKAFLMDHSAYDAYAFEVKDKESVIIYSGDFRSHGRKSFRFENFLRKASKNADILFLEGTNLGNKKESKYTEKNVEEKIISLLDGSYPVLFQCSAQNVDRLVSFYKAAARKKRWLVIDIYTAEILTKLHQLGTRIPYPSLQYPLIKVFYPFFQTKGIYSKKNSVVANQFRPFYISKSFIKANKNKVLMMVRPSFMIDLKKIGVQNGIYIYSLWQGYRSLATQKKFEIYLENNGFLFHSIHSSGHATHETLKKTLTILNPKRCIPVHSAHPNIMKEMSSSVHVLENNNEIMC